MESVTQHRGRRRARSWVAALCVSLVVLRAGTAAGSGVGEPVAAGGSIGAGRSAGHAGGGRSGRAPLSRGRSPHGHRGRHGFVFLYPYDPYDDYDPDDPDQPYDDAYCDPWSSYYSLDLCYGD